MEKSYFSQIKLIGLIPISLLLFGCGTFDLGTVFPVNGQSVTQRDSDMAVCKVKAFEAANTKERQAGAFIAGMTIIGAPLAIEDEKRLQRKIFKECMEDKGYAVEPPNDKQNASVNSSVAGTGNNQQNVSVKKPDGKLRISIDMGPEWVDEKISDDLKKSGVIIFKVNHTINAGFLVSSIKSSYIKDPSKYVETTNSLLESILKNPQRSEVKIIEINGSQLAQYETWGTQLVNGTNLEMKYLSYLLVDKEDTFLIRFNTLVHNYDFQRPIFEEKMNSVSVREPQKVFTNVKRARPNLSTNQIKQQCKNLGFSEGTDEYAACLGEILSREK